MSHSHAVIVLPAGSVARDAPPAARRWLARARWSAAPGREEPLVRVLRLLGHPEVAGGMAALRQWGQTGERSAGWLCGADPVYLEARLDHLWLHAVDDLDEAEFAALVAHLETRLGWDGHCMFSRVGSCGYLASEEPIATAAVSAATSHQASPDRFLPAGRAAAAHDRLQGELQLCLNDWPGNARREEAGQAPVNALWLWGGGMAPEPLTRALPRLFADDPLFTGYWHSAGAACAPWPGSLERCTAAARRGFVAVLPDDGDTPPLETLGSVPPPGRVTLVFPDGLRAELRTLDRLRIWRRELRLPAPAGGP